MYQLDQLLAMLTIEKAKHLQFRAGSPPIMVTEREQRALQGPKVTQEDVMGLLKSMATSRQMRELRQRGALRFVYTLPNRSPFLIRAKMEDENVEFDIS